MSATLPQTGTQAPWTCHNCERCLLPSTSQVQNASPSMRQRQPSDGVSRQPSYSFWSGSNPHPTKRSPVSVVDVIRDVQVPGTSLTRSQHNSQSPARDGSVPRRASAGASEKWHDRSVPRGYDTAALSVARRSPVPSHTNPGALGCGAPRPIVRYTRVCMDCGHHWKPTGAYRMRR
jgi:hypothetical protein